MKRYLPVTAVLLGAAITFYSFAPALRSSASILRSWRLANPELAALQDQLGAQQDSIRLLRGVRERVLARETAGRLPSSSAPFVFTSAPDVSPQTRDAFEQRVRTELDSIGGALRYPIRLHLLVDSLSNVGYQSIVVLPRDATEPCTIVTLIATRPNGATKPMADDRLVGTCGFHAAFGAPGPGMANWLLTTRGIHAASVNAPTRRASGNLYRMRGGDLFRAPEAAACSAGNDSLCIVSWAGSRWMRNLALADSGMAAVTAGTVRVSVWAARGIPGRNLSDLRDAMTDARFVELWRSALEPTEAYEELEGRSIAHFVRERIHEESVPHRPGPLRAELPFLLAVLVAGGAAALTFRFAKRRRS